MKYLSCVVLSLLLVGCGLGSGMTQNNLDKVQNDMSPQQVQAILGAPTESKTDPIPVVGGTETTYTYTSNSSQVTIVFKNDKVTEKHGSFGP